MKAHVRTRLVGGAIRSSLGGSRKDTRTHHGAGEPRADDAAGVVLRGPVLQERLGGLRARPRGDDARVEGVLEEGRERHEGAGELVLVHVLLLQDGQEQLVVKQVKKHDMGLIPVAPV